jgi:hypothetical protein
MVQEVLLMRQMESQLRGKLVAWFIYFGNDLYDNLLPNLYHYRMPFVRQVRGKGDWEIVTEHVGPERWPFNFEGDTRGAEKFSRVFGDATVSGRTYSACEFLIGEGKKICDGAGANLVVMTIPWPIQLEQSVWQRQASRFGGLKSFQRDMPDQQLAAICERLEVPLVATRQHLTMADHIPNEGHWNERGHRKVAALLATLHREHVSESERTARVLPALDYRESGDSWRRERRERSISEAT